jgi:hypothetical protein
MVAFVFAILKNYFLVSNDKEILAGGFDSAEISAVD